jgi:hypothetical protein
MVIGNMLTELINLFDYKKPLVHVEEVKRNKLTPPAAILTLLFHWDKDRQVVTTFHVADSGVVATVSTKHKAAREVYSGSGTPKEVAVTVVNWLQKHFSTRPPTKTSRI